MNKIINLLPKSENREIKMQLVAAQVLNFWFYAGLSLVILFMVGLAALIFLRGEISNTDEAVTEKKLELSASDTKQLQANVIALNTQISSIEVLQKANYHWSEVIAELAKITPDGVHLSSVDMDRASNKIEVAGVADSRGGVIDFWSNVKKSSYFRNINFPFTNLEKEQDATFTFTFYLNSELVKNESPN